MRESDLLLQRLDARPCERGEITGGKACKVILISEVLQRLAAAAARTHLPTDVRRNRRGGQCSGSRPGDALDEDCVDAAEELAVGLRGANP
jgi:hypothetical protein